MKINMMKMDSFYRNRRLALPKRLVYLIQLYSVDSNILEEFRKLYHMFKDLNLVLYLSLQLLLPLVFHFHMYVSIVIPSSDITFVFQINTFVPLEYHCRISQKSNLGYRHRNLALWSPEICKLLRRKCLQKLNCR